ncbi:MAG: Asp-tRNA(Asn)/Glu-tRNA(Gln) amidotransferase subunit GatB [Candidatus Paceibacterota bacterium]|jgi:aspartyl-tRNA(Asn)/glutamyl-tRNA(Gln) amidotransferase subunit B
MAKQYYTTIGLEIHAELNTKSKMFCGCVNDPNEKTPNVNICPVCMAHPGTLPVINKQAVENVIKVGLALGANIADFTEFDRKNYFYPDIPKGYQISQYKFPIVSGGKLRGVDITRVHLEEDTATSKHDRGDYSLVDFNRAGVPLMELVTEPIIHSSKEAGDFGRELQLLLRYLGVSEANMEKGEMRVELNISVSDDPNKFGTKIEVKNINSFRAMERAAEYEVKRMTELLESGKGSEIVQETRGWDENKQSTFSQRTKENANDYRYFPDPDLPKLFLNKIFDIEKIRSELPELPEERRNRYRNDYGIKDEDIESYINKINLSRFFEDVALRLNANKGAIKIASSLISNDILGLITREIQKPILFSSDALASLIFMTREEHSGNYCQSDFNLYKMTPELFKNLVILNFSNEIGSRATKDLLPEIINSGRNPSELAKEKGLIQNHDEGALKEIVQKIIDANPAVVATYKGGKENAIMSLVGQVMKESKGSANPALVQKILKELLN